MANLYFFNEDAPSLTMTLDNGVVCHGVRSTHKGRNCFAVTVPDGASGGITVDTPGYTWNSSQRGLLNLPNNANPEFTFSLDDIRGTVSAAPEPPGPTYPTGTPQEIINAVYHQGNFDLSTKKGCGTFTEACCDALHASDPMWGHIKKNPGQNQWNSHAVDAVMLLAGSACGGYDIILDSESPNAQPSYTYKGEPDPSLWFYPAATA